MHSLIQACIISMGIMCASAQGSSSPQPWVQKEPYTADTPNELWALAKANDELQKVAAIENGTISQLSQAVAKLKVCWQYMKYT